MSRSNHPCEGRHDTKGLPPLPQGMAYCPHVLVNDMPGGVTETNPPEPEMGWTAQRQHQIDMLTDREARLLKELPDGEQGNRP